MSTFLLLFVNNHHDSCPFLSLNIVETALSPSSTITQLVDDQKNRSKRHAYNRRLAYDGLSASRPDVLCSRGRSMAAAWWKDGGASTGDGSGWTSSTTLSRDVDDETTDIGERRSSVDIHAGALR